MKKLVAITACLSVLLLTSCRHDQADEIFEEPAASGNVFLKNSDSAKMWARDSTGTSSVTSIETDPPIPPRK